MAGLGPYPQPYTMQDEQRAEPRREKRASPDRRGELTYLLVVAIVIVVAVAVTLFLSFWYA